MATERAQGCAELIGSFGGLPIRCITLGHVLSSVHKWSWIPGCMTRQKTYAVSPQAVLVSDLVSALFEGLPLLDDIIPTIFLIITIQIGDPCHDNTPSVSGRSQIWVLFLVEVDLTYC